MKEYLAYKIINSMIINIFKTNITLVLCFLLMNIHLYAQTEYEESSPRLINGVPVPSDYPAFIPTITSDSVGPGYLMLINASSPQSYIHILKSDGTPVFYRKNNMKYGGVKVLPNGNLSFFSDINRFCLLDLDYDTVAFIGSEGIGACDGHEICYLGNDRYLVIDANNITVDLSDEIAGGNESATIRCNIIQEVDAEGNVYWEWNACDHYTVYDLIYEELTSASFDMPHINSIALDYDDNILISGKHTSECAKIDKETGEFIWRLGGENSTLSLINDTISISCQHYFRPVKDKPNYYTIFDNGNDRKSTRVVEYKIDTEANTAEKIWEYWHDPKLWAWWMGSAQRLENGNTVIGWAVDGLPAVTEIDSNGNVLYEGDFEENSHVYRVHRCEWDGKKDQPELIIEPYPDNVHLIYNQFGDTTVKTYYVYGGTSTTPTTLIATTTEPWCTLANLETRTDYYFRVRTKDSDGNLSPYSNTEKVFVNYHTPNENIIENGEFTADMSDWNLELADETVATMQSSNSTAKISISSAGSDYDDVTLVQPNIPLVEGKTYIFEFKAKASSTRIFESKIVRATDPYTNYGEIGDQYVGSSWKEFSFEFVMEERSDLNAEVLFGVGAATGDFYIDNASLIMYDTNYSSLNPETYNRTGNFLNADIFPNPVINYVSIHFESNSQQNITLEIINPSGSAMYKNESFSVYPGESEITINTQGYPKGIYLLRYYSHDNNTHTLKFVKQ